LASSFFSENETQARFEDDIHTKFKLTSAINAKITDPWKSTRKGKQMLWYVHNYIYIFLITNIHVHNA